MKQKLFLPVLAVATALSGAAWAEGDMQKSASDQQMKSQSTAMERQAGDQSQQKSQESQGYQTQASASSDAAQSHLTAQEVGRIQQALVASGQDIDVDGVWGPNTADALLAWSERQGTGQQAPQTASMPDDAAGPQQDEDSSLLEGNVDPADAPEAVQQRVPDIDAPKEEGVD